MNGSLDIHPKVAGATATGALALVVLWVLSLFHVTVQAEVAGALAMGLSVVGGYLAPILSAEQKKLEGK